MAAVHEIGIASETRAFEQGIKSGVIDPLEDAEKKLDELGKSRGPEQLERDLKDAQRQTEKLADETKTTARQIERSYRDAGDVGGKSFRRLGDQGEEISGELRQNLGETFSSFRGDLEDLPQIAQDTLGGLAGSGALGGIPALAATAAGAAGLGLVIGAFQNIEEEAQASRDRINGWAESFTEAGAKVLDASIVQSRMNEILTDTDGQLKTAKERAEQWGTSVEDAVLAMAGHQPTLDKVRDSLQEQGDEWVKLTENGYTFTASELEKFQALQLGREEFKKLTGEMAEGASVVDIMSAANINLINSTKDVTKEVDEFGNELYTLPDGKQIMIDAETGMATENVEGFKGDLDGIPETVNTTVQARVNFDDRAFWGYMDRLQRRAAQGVTVQARVGQGRLWE